MEFDTLEFERKQFASSIRVARALTAIAASDAFEVMGYPENKELSASFEAFLHELSNLDPGVDEKDLILSSNLLHNGFMSISDVLINTIKTSDASYSAEEAFTVSQHPTTTETFRGLARQSPSYARMLVGLSSRLNVQPFHILSAGDGLDTLHGDLPFNQKFGCPAAKHNHETVSKTFDEFVRWSGNVAIQSYFQTRQAV